jgi:hypothetical protein
VVLPVSVRKIDQIEKLKVKKKTKSFKYTGAEICPEYGKDFTITAPKGYSGITDQNGDLLPSEVGVMYVNNVAPGKMAVVIYGTGSGNYYGMQVIYFKIKK